MELLLLLESVNSFKVLFGQKNEPGTNLGLLTEIETEQTVPPICINFSSFLDETVCSVPDLEEIPNPDLTDYPSFLGQNYENRDCTRVLRSNVSKSSFHPLHSL